MKYYTDETLIEIYRPDYSGQSIEEFVKSQNDEYNREYDTASGRISQRAVKTLESHLFFHDWGIESVKYINSVNKKKDKVLFSLASLNFKSEVVNCYSLEFYEVSDFRCNVKNSTPEQMPLGMEAVYRIEILPFAEDRVSIEFVTSEGSTVYFTCKGIIARKCSLWELN